ncbi:hypothetical protein MHYP_G00093840 [Metynnis hypsauchen]
MAELNTVEGSRVKKTSDILGVVEEYYTDLYSESEIDYGALEEILGNSSKRVPLQDYKFLVEDWTVKELEVALKGFKTGADRAIFYFLWGSKWERLRREVVKRRPENGGKGVPDLYTFLGSIFVATHMKYALTRAEGKTGAMVRFGLGSYLRRLKILKKQEPVCLVRGLGEGESRQVWANAAHPALLNRHRDLAWMAAHEVLPVRAVMHSRGMAKNAICPWPRCGAPETVRHALWECRAAQDLWSITGALWCPSLSAGGAPALRYRVAVNGFIFLGLLDQHEGFPAQPRGRRQPLPGHIMEQGPRSTPGFLGSVPRTVRFQWRNTEAGDAFPDRVPFIREVLFGALGLKTEDLVCAQRNNAARFFDVAMSSEGVYQRVLERGVDVTVHLFNPFVTAEAIKTFLRRYGEVQPGETMVRDELGIWNGRRQFMVEFREDGKGGLTHPPAYFSLNGNKGYLFYRGQPAFCRGCLQHGHEVSGCKDLNCKNCLGQGHQARDCKNPRRCKSCGGEGHLAHSCPRREATYATVLAGAGGGPVVPRTVGEEGQTGTGAQGSNEPGAPAAAIAASSPGVAGGPAPGPHPLAGKEAPPISRPVKRARKRRRAQDEEMERRQRAGSPGAAPEGAPISPPCAP